MTLCRACKSARLGQPQVFLVPGHLSLLDIHLGLSLEHQQVLLHDICAEGHSGCVYARLGGVERGSLHAGLHER
jgi:hypothetical protein